MIVTEIGLNPLWLLLNKLLVLTYSILENPNVLIADTAYLMVQF